MGSWVRTITTPFRKASKKVLNPTTHDKNSQRGPDNHAMILRGEVMACGYEDVQVMWSMLDKPSHLLEQDCRSSQ